MRTGTVRPIQSGRPGQVDDDVLRRAARELRSRAGGSPRRPARRRVVPTSAAFSAGLNVPLQRLQRHDPPRLLLLRHIVGQPLVGQRVRPRRVLEREHAVIPHGRGQRQRLLEVGVGLAREPDDHIGRERHVRQRLADARDELEIALARVAPPHRLEDARRAGLHRQVQVPADLRQAAPSRRGTASSTCRGCGLANRIRSMPATSWTASSRPREVARRVVRRLRSG